VAREVVVLVLVVVVGCPFMFGSASGKPVEGTLPMTGRSVATPPTAATTTAATANAAEKVDAGAARRRVM